MPKKTPQEVLSNWKNTWYLCKDSAVAVSPAAFNLAINMLHLIWQRFVLLFFMASSGGRLKLANVFSFLLPVRKLRLVVVFVTQCIRAQFMRQKPV